MANKRKTYYCVKFIMSGESLYTGTKDHEAFAAWVPGTVMGQSEVDARSAEENADRMVAEHRRKGYQPWRT